MPLNPIDKAKRRAAVLERFRQETGFTRVEEGSINRALIDNLMDELDNEDLNWEEELRNIFPYTAQSPYVEMWAENFGIEYVGPQRLQALASQKIVKIKVLSGTFGDLNGGDDITLLSDSFLIYGNSSLLEEGELSEAAVTYELIQDTVLDAAASEAWLSVIASGPGEGYRLDTNGITGHNFTSYVNYPDQELVVENVLPLLGGQDGSNEDSIRGSIARANIAKTENIEDSISRDIEALPSVDDVVVVRNYSSFNSLDIFVDTISYVIPDYIIEQAQIAVDRLNSRQDLIRVHKMKRVGVAFESAIKFKKGVNETRKLEIIEEIKVGMLDYFSRQIAGASIDFNEIYNQINSQYREISYIGKNKNNFDKIILFHPSLNNKKYERVYSSNFTLQLKRFEKLYPEVEFPNVFNFYEDR